MSLPRWATDPDAVIAEAAKADQIATTYGTGCAAIVGLLLGAALVVGSFYGLLALFR